MDNKINALNVEIGAFLQNLRRYVSGSQQVSIGNKTVELLLDTVTFIEGQLIGKADIIDVLNETNPNFLQDLDPSHFDLQRSFMCRLCNTSMPVTREDVHEHVSNDSHLKRLPRLPRLPRTFLKQKFGEKLSSSTMSNKMHNNSSVSSDDKNGAINKKTHSSITNSQDSSNMSRKASANSKTTQPKQTETGGLGVKITSFDEHVPQYLQSHSANQDYNTSMLAKHDDSHAHVRENSHVVRLSHTPHPLPPQKVDDKISSPAASNRMQNKFTVPSDVENGIVKKDTHRYTKGSDDSFENDLKVSAKSKSMQPKQMESYGMDNFVGTSWANVQQASDSDCSWDAPIREFNFDSKYLIQVRNLPLTATKPGIVEFFEKISILNGMDGIHFIPNDKITKNIEAFVQLESLRDYTAALKLSEKIMDGQCIKVLAPQQQYQFHHLIQTRQIPSKERVVFMENLPSNYTEQDIRTFFDGLTIHSIQFTQGGTSAYVKFTVVDDVEFAIKRNDNKSKICIYRSSAHQMQKCANEENSHPTSQLPLRLPSVASLRRDLAKISTKVVDTQHPPPCSAPFLKVCGLPTTINKSYVFGLFIGLQLNDVQLQRNDRGLLNGAAIVAFENTQDYEMALKLNISDLHRGTTLTRATESEYMLAKELNEKFQSKP